MSSRSSLSHGWQHDARSDDGTSAFRVLLNNQSTYEKKRASPGAKAASCGWAVRRLPRVVGFRLGNVVTDATFWGRQAAGQREVATGSVRELFGRLRHYRTHRRGQRGAASGDRGAPSRSMIVFSALAQSLIEAASAPVVGRMTPDSPICVARKLAHRGRALHPDL